MDVKMHTIKAGPSGCADAGTIVTLPDVEAQKLIDGKFAVKASAPLRETAMISPAMQAQLDRDRAKAIADERAANEERCKSPDNILSALKELDMDDDEDWTAAGKPSVDRVKQITGSTTLSRAEIDDLFPDFSRAGAQTDPDQVQATPDKAAATVAVKADDAPVKSGARSNKP